MSDKAETGTGLGTPDRPERAGNERRPGRLRRVITFYKQVVAELRKVIWPTRRELLTYTAVVLVFVVFMSPSSACSTSCSARACSRSSATASPSCSAPHPPSPRPEQDVHVSEPTLPSDAPDEGAWSEQGEACLLYTSPSPRDS